MSHPFRIAVESQDLQGMSALLAEDVVFNSPVAFQPFRGRAVVTEVLDNVMQVFADFRYVDELAGDETHALVFEATVGGRSVQGLDYLTLGEHGLIRDFTVMVRPLSAVIALAEQMAPRVAHLPKG